MIMDLSKNIEQLRQMTEKVLQLQDMVKIEKAEAVYQTKTGTCKGTALFNIDKIAVQLATLSPDTELLPHKHDDCEEILICYEGDLEILTKEDKSRIITTVIYIGGVIMIRQGVTHIAKSINGCQLIAITIPASPGYPPNAEKL
jgi:mannose-6-phosphate isomerase-like protein (cupin superfamily)